MQNCQPPQREARAALWNMIVFALYLGTTAELLAGDSGTGITIHPSPMDSALPAGVDEDTGYRMQRCVY